jgi:hypothetical protein
MPTPTRRRRTVFDLTPQELFELRKLNINVNATTPPKRPRPSGAYDSYQDFSFDYGIYERYRDLHERAKTERSAWLQSHRITLSVMAQVKQTRYNPYKNAAVLGCVIPPLPEGYAEAFQALFKPVPTPTVT